MAIFLYAFLAWWITHSSTGTRNLSGIEKMLIPVFCVMSVGQAVASFILRMRAYGTGGDSVWHDVQSSERELNEEERARLPGALSRLQTYMIISLALSEAVGIYGLLLTFMTMKLEFTFVFLIPALILVSLHFPSKDKIERSVMELVRDSEV